MHFSRLLSFIVVESNLTCSPSSIREMSNALFVFSLLRKSSILLTSKAWSVLPKTVSIANSQPSSTSMVSISFLVFLNPFYFSIQ